MSPYLPTWWFYILFIGTYNMDVYSGHDDVDGEWHREERKAPPRRQDSRSPCWNAVVNNSIPIFVISLYFVLYIINMVEKWTSITSRRTCLTTTRLHRSWLSRSLTRGSLQNWKTTRESWCPAMAGMTQAFFSFIHFIIYKFWIHPRSGGEKCGA